MFKKRNELTVFQTAVLQVVAEAGPASGTEIIRYFEERYNGQGNPTTSKTYPALNKLIRIDIVESESVNGRRNSYSLTETGREFVEYMKDDWNHTFQEC